MKLILIDLPNPQSLIPIRIDGVTCWYARSRRCRVPTRTEPRDGIPHYPRDGMPHDAMAWRRGRVQECEASADVLVWGEGLNGG